ncbi:MAG: hypothetical protein O3A95_02745 [Planctomycetota bacterium]|nr:hypothetical protein [Planctomycetota bacterium]MDA1113202.1 hypothetical protein [Planctomycetota bacterium]
MLSILLLLVFSPSPAQEPGAEATAPNAVVSTEVQNLLDAVALQQGEKTYTVAEVVAELYPLDGSLQEALESNAEYLHFYIDSLRFYNQVRWFSNLLLLDDAKIPNVDQEALLAEASAWDLDRGGDGRFPESLLARGGLEIVGRARLVALQPKEYSMREIRTHFNRSIPEFFGRLKVSWIRLPLFDMETNRAVGEEERIARYNLLDEVASKLTSEEITWASAVERYCEDPVSSKQGGRVGYIKRTDHRFDEDFLRQVFVDFGITVPNSAVLRGPITGSRWIYLARVEKVFTEGVVDVQRVRDRVIRSLRVYNMFQRLHSLATGTSRWILLPIQQG